MSATWAKRSACTSRFEGLHELQWGAARPPEKLALPHHRFPAQDRADREARDAHAVIWGPAATACDPLVFDRARRLHIYDREVGVEADGNPALGRQPEHALRPVRRQIDETLEREAPGVHVIE